MYVCMNVCMYVCKYVWADDDVDPEQSSALRRKSRKECDWRDEQAGGQLQGSQWSPRAKRRHVQGEGVASRAWCRDAQVAGCDASFPTTSYRGCSFSATNKKSIQQQAVHSITVATTHTKATHLENKNMHGLNNSNMRCKIFVLEEYHTKV